MAERKSLVGKEFVAVDACVNDFAVWVVIFFFTVKKAGEFFWNLEARLRAVATSTKAKRVGLPEVRFVFVKPINQIWFKPGLTLNRLNQVSGINLVDGNIEKWVVVENSFVTSVKRRVNSTQNLSRMQNLELNWVN